MPVMPVPSAEVLSPFKCRHPCKVIAMLVQLQHPLLSQLDNQDNSLMLLEVVNFLSHLAEKDPSLHLRRENMVMVMVKMLMDSGSKAGQGILRRGQARSMLMGLETNNHLSSTILGILLGKPVQK